MFGGQNFAWVKFCGGQKMSGVKILMGQQFIFRPIRGQDIIIWRRLSKSTTNEDLLPAKLGSQVLRDCKLTGGFSSEKLNEFKLTFRCIWQCPVSTIPWFSCWLIYLRVYLFGDDCAPKTVELKEQFIEFGLRQPWGSNTQWLSYPVTFPL